MLRELFFIVERLLFWCWIWYFFDVAVIFVGEFMYFNGQADMLGPALEKEIGPKFFMAREGRMTNVWMGNQGTTAPLHHDPFENFFVQIYGT